MQKTIPTIIGLFLLFFFSCTPEENNSPVAPPPLEGQITFASTAGESDTVDITSILFEDTIGSIIHCKIEYYSWPYNYVVRMYVNGTGSYIFQSNPGVIINRNPDCGGPDSDPGGTAYSSLIGDTSSNVNITQFGLDSIAGAYNGKFIRYGVDGFTCAGYLIDTVSASGTFYATGY